MYISIYFMSLEINDHLTFNNLRGFKLVIIEKQTQNLIIIFFLLSGGTCIK